jgi:hypothetical protein
MIDVIAYLTELENNRSEIQTGIHCVLREGYNRYTYAIGFISVFSLMYFLINKIVYKITDNKYIYELCVQKVQEKSKNKKIISESTQKEIVYQLWFYRFSWMECISCLFLWPILIYVLFSFNSFHNKIFTYVDWSNYIIKTMIIGHYIVDIIEVVSNNYVKRSRDLLLHHIVVSLCFLYHLTSLLNYPWITTLLFMEFNSFFNRFNLIQKFHDPQKTGIVFNLSNIFNFITMIFVRFVTIIFMFMYTYLYQDLIPAYYFYFRLILLCLFTMIYLACQSFKYMIFADLKFLKLFLSGSKHIKKHA